LNASPSPSKDQGRSTVAPGDWIAGTGSKHARVGTGQTKDMSGRLVYAMKVTDTMSMSAYDRYAQEQLTIKIPDWSSADAQKRLGDAIYEFSGGTARQRPGVHGAGNVDTDLAGRNALLSTHFFYFGANAIALPDHLLDIAQNRQGHRVHKNKPLCANVAETPTTRKISVEGDRGIRDDEWDGEDDRGLSEGAPAPVHDRREAAGAARGGRLRRPEGCRGGVAAA
jgi:hypothetical protein